MNVTIDGKSYEFSDQVREDPALRKSFAKLGLETFSFDFNGWYNNGFWGEEYIPHVLMNRDKVISSVSASRLDFQFGGKTLNTLQLGSVMTSKKYRNQGLSNALLEYTINKWKNQCDLIYLFAGKAVESHYTKFGFLPVTEYAHMAPAISNSGDMGFRKIDLTNRADQNLLVKLVSRGSCYSRLKMLNGMGLVMYYLATTMFNDLYYSKEHDVIIAARIDNPSIVCIDIFGYEPRIGLTQLVSGLPNEGAEGIIYCFTPRDTSNCTPIIMPQDDRLFVLQKTDNPVITGNFMLPICSRA